MPKSCSHSSVLSQFYTTFYQPNMRAENQTTVGTDPLNDTLAIEEIPKDQERTETNTHLSEPYLEITTVSPHTESTEIEISRPNKICLLLAL